METPNKKLLDYLESSQSIKDSIEESRKDILFGTDWLEEIKREEREHPFVPYKNPDDMPPAATPVVQIVITTPTTSPVPTPPTPPTVAAAMRYIAAGLVILPSHSKTKVPTNHDGADTQGWQTVDAESARYRFTQLAANPNQHQNAISLICGPSHAEVVDFDLKAVQYPAWAKLIPTDLLSKFPIESTPSGGMHVGYKCEKIEGNLKLSRPPKPADVKEWKAYIETRGDGGQCLISPSPGYTMIQGDWADIPTITPDERDILICAARSLTEYVPEPKKPKTSTPSTKKSSTSSFSSADIDRPGDRYNAGASYSTTQSLLLTAGWSEAGEGHVTRPGKDSGVSGTIFDNGVFYCFTTSNSDFEGGEAYSPFSVYTIVDHNKDYSAAAKALAAEYGMTFVTKGLSTAPSSKAKSPTSGPQELPQDWTLDEVNWDDVQGDVEWLWTNRIPFESITLFAGIGGLGKSTIALAFATAISNGKQFPDGQVAPLGDTLVFSAEDANKVVKSRLLRQGADINRIHKIEGAKLDEKHTKYFDVQDIEVLERALAKYPETKLIIIDPIASYVSGIDAHKNADVRRVMVPLNKFAEKYKLAIILIVHLNKDDAKGAENRISGSSAWRDLARSVWFVVPNKAEPSGSLFLPNKNNNGPLGNGFNFTYEGGTLSWGGETALTLADAMKPELKETNASMAEEWLRLKLAGGEREARWVEADAGRVGIKEHALKAALKAVAVKPYRKEFSGGWWWKLKPEEGCFSQ